MRVSKLNKRTQPKTTPQALIDTRKYIGGWLFYGQVQRTFHNVVDEMEREMYSGTTIKCMKTAYHRTVTRLKTLNMPEKLISKYVSDIRRATQGAINDELQG